MNFESLWWIWIVVGAVFLIIELMISTFFALWMAVAAIIPGIIVFIAPKTSLEMQILYWIIAMIICSFLWVRFSKRDTPLPSSDEELVGQIGVLAQSCDQNKKGILLLQKPIEGLTQWKCVANISIPADTRVVVVEKIDKNLVRVEYQ